MAERQDFDFKTGDLLGFEDENGDFKIAEVSGSCGPDGRSVVLMLGTHNQAYTKEYLLGKGNARQVRLSQLIILVNKTAACPVQI